MKRRSLLCIFSVAVFFVAVEVRAMDVAVSEEAPVDMSGFAGPIQMQYSNKTFQEKDKEGYFILKALNTDGSRAVTFDQAGEIIVWDTASGTALTKVPGNFKKEKVESLEFYRGYTPDEDNLIKIETKGYVTYYPAGS